MFNESLEGLYEMLAREKLSVHSYGATRTSPEFEEKFLKELTAGKTMTIPPRSTVVVSNDKK